MLCDRKQHQSSYRISIAIQRCLSLRSNQAGWEAAEAALNQIHVCAECYAQSIYFLPRPHVDWHLPFCSFICLNNTNYGAVEGEERDENTCGEEDEKTNCSMRTEVFAWLFACRSCASLAFKWFAYRLGATGQSSCHSNWDTNAPKAHFGYHFSFPYVLQ